MYPRKLYIPLLGLLPLFLYGCDDDDAAPTDNVPKPEMNITVSPQSNLSYGDKVYVTGTLTDEKNLKMYTILLKDTEETELYRKEQMLLGQSFHMNENFSIPLPKNAETGNLHVEVILENSRNGESVQNIELTSLQVPTFRRLYLLLGNKSVVELSPNGDVFEAEETFPPHIKGIISTTPTGTGLYWGTSNGEIRTMVKDSIMIGGDIEASCKITFNPRTFELTFGERHGWTSLPATDSYYILGTISGHWQDGEIKTEKAKMRMQGYESGNENWTLTTATGKYFLRLDAFSGSCYARPVNGYPDAIYMYGWSWAHSETGTAQNWQVESALPLVRTGSGHVYEGTCYVFSWGGDIAFMLTSPSEDAKVELPNANFGASSGIFSGNPTHFLLPTAAGYYKISVNLKEGVVIDEDSKVVTPVNAGSKFTLRYMLQ